MKVNIGTKDAVTLTLSNVKKGTEEKIEYSKNGIKITQSKVKMEGN